MLQLTGFNRAFAGVVRFSSNTTGGNVEDDIVHLEDRPDITIPLYPTRPDEPFEQRKQR